MVRSGRCNSSSADAGVVVVFVGIDQGDEWICVSKRHHFGCRWAITSNASPVRRARPPPPWIVPVP